MWCDSVMLTIIPTYYYSDVVESDTGTDCD